MNNIKIKEILIDRVEDLQVKIIDGRVEGDLNKVIWVDLEKIASAITNMIINIGEKAKFISYYTPIKNNAVRTGIKVTLSFDSEKTSPEDIELLVIEFLSDICKRDNYSAELFSQDPHPFDEVVKRETINFLSKNGGKHIKHPLKISTGGSLIKMVSKFGQIANPDQFQDDPPETHFGIVDGLVKHSRTVHLKLTTSKNVVAYFNQNDFLELHQLMLSEEPHQFTLQQKYDPNGKKDMYLIAVKEYVEELLNFSS